MDWRAQELLSGRQAAFSVVPPPIPKTLTSRLRREWSRILRRPAPIWPIPVAFAAHLAAVRRLDWIVYAKKPFGGPAQVLAYLGRYTHRVAIANSRIQTCDDEHVGFTWKDYRDDGAVKTMSPKPDEFIRRFLLHALARRLLSHSTLRSSPMAIERKGWPSVARSDNRGRANSARKARTGLARTDNQTGVDPPPRPECGGTMRLVADLPLAANGLGPKHRRFGAILMSTDVTIPPTISVRAIPSRQPSEGTTCYLAASRRSYRRSGVVPARASPSSPSTARRTDQVRATATSQVEATTIRSSPTQGP